jgi:hypothetical protein
MAHDTLAASDLAGRFQLYRVSLGGNCNTTAAASYLRRDADTERIPPRNTNDTGRVDPVGRNANQPAEL